jgi:hypothetical protein
LDPSDWPILCVTPFKSIDFSDESGITFASSADRCACEHAATTTAATKLNNVEILDRMKILFNGRNH